MSQKPLHSCRANGNNSGLELSARLVLLHGFRQGPAAGTSGLGSICTTPAMHSAKYGSLRSRHILGVFGRFEIC